MLLAMMAAIANGSPSLAADAGPVCEHDQPRLARGAPGTSPDARPRRLDELPPANLVLTVLRREDGCVVPQIVRYGIGAPKREP